MYNDGTYFYFRLRLDRSPAGTGGQGYMEPYGWGVEIDSNMDPRNYEWLIIVDGISQSETISLWQNTVQRTVGDPGDRAEIRTASVPLAGNFQISAANTAFNASQDYFLDWRFPYDTFKQSSGITDTTPIRLFFGSSSSADALTENGADLVGASDLIAGFSDYVIPLERTPTTGSVMFVSNLAGTGDVTSITQGDTIFIKVTDGDMNLLDTSVQTLTVVLTNQNGDTETVTLMETGVNTGVFTGSKATVSALPVAGDGTFQIRPGETITVTYIDRIDANRNTNQSRTDTLTVGGPSISVSKTVSAAAAVAGDVLTYTITITNSGSGDAWLNTIQDNLSAGFSYVQNSAAGLTTSNPSISNQTLIWNGSWIVPRRVGAVNGSVTLSFQAVAGGIAGIQYNSAVASGANFSPVSTGGTAAVTMSAPVMTLTKQVAGASYTPGSVLTYSVIYRNTGSASATNFIITDAVPDNATYVPGSLRMGNAASTFATAAVKTDAADADEAEVVERNILYRVNLIAPDDGVAGAGADEGIVYFQVTID
jgi:uncharacterized repeat protein (TIGR01451 family)